MKTLKTTISKTKYLALALFVAFSFSCSTDDGEDGAPGAQGEAGVAGTNGNANVQIITINMSTETGTFDEVAVPQLTQDVIDNDVILGYIKRGTSLFPVPTVEDSSIIPFGVSVRIRLGLYGMDYVDGSTGGSHTIVAGDIDELKVVIIESTSTTAGKTSTKQQVKTELAQAGIDINNYYAVCDYYGIAY